MKGDRYIMARPVKMPGSHTGNYTKEQQAIQNDNRAKLEGFTPLDFERVPNSLTKRERKEWLRLSQDLYGLPLSELDRNLLISYCSYWSMFIEAKENRDKLGVLVQEERNGYMISKRNPAIDIMATATREIKAISADLGLNLNGRLQLINAMNTSDEEDGDPFDF